MKRSASLLAATSLVLLWIPALPGALAAEEQKPMEVTYYYLPG